MTTDDLIWSWSHGTINDDELLVLEKHLAQDRAARMRFTAMCLEDIALIQCLQINSLREKKEKFPHVRASNKNNYKKKTINRRPVLFSPLVAGLAASFLLIISLFLYQNKAPVDSANKYAAAVISGALFDKTSELSATALKHVSYGETVRTTEEACLLTLYDIQARIELAPYSSVVIHPKGDMHLFTGQVMCHVEPLQPTQQFIVHGTHTFAQVVGTQFTVTETDESTTVAVQHGHVRSRNQAGEDVTLHAHQSLIVTRPHQQELVADNYPLHAVLISESGESQKYENNGTAILKQGEKFSVQLYSDIKISTISTTINDKFVGTDGTLEVDAEQRQTKPPFFIFGDVRRVPTMKSLDPGQYSINITAYHFENKIEKKMMFAMTLIIKKP